MSNSNVIHLPAQVVLPSLKEIGTFIARIRRELRLALAARDGASDEMDQCRRSVQTLKQTGNTLDAEPIQKLERRVDELTEQKRVQSDSVRMHGYALMNAVPIIDECTTLAQRCDMLNINVADREGLCEFDGLAALIFDHGKEDSAACRHCEVKDGPLFHAINRVFLDFLRTSRDGPPGGRSTVSPGGLFFDCLVNPLPTLAATPPTFH